MKILTINTTPYGSVARIAIETAELAEKKGFENRLAFGYSTHPLESKYFVYQFNTFLFSVIDILFRRLTGLMGVYSIYKTWRFIKKVEAYDPDIIHLHNLHGCINIGIVVNYIKKHNKPVVWTFHDCWSFTGHCVHFDYIKCEKWKKQCFKCPLYREFPQVYVDNSRQMYKLKKKWFGGLPNVTLVSPSYWMASKIKESFLSGYPLKVIHNGINLEIFNIHESDFRSRYQLENKFIILGVAFGWGHKKGLDAFVELSKRLSNDYKIVLVGTNEVSDKLLPEQILSIHTTQNQQELSDIYCAADLFVNLTREDTFPTVNIEAIACGTPIVTFNTGGSPEIINETCGFVVEQDNIDELVDRIEFTRIHRPFTKEACRARAMDFDKNNKFIEYIELYKSIVNIP